MRLELGDVRGHTSTLAERLGTGKLLQTGGLERIVNTGHFFCVYRSIGLLMERDGENVAIVYRWAEGQLDQLPALAAELVRRRVSVIAAFAPAAALAAKATTTTIPIVFLVSNDPVIHGLVASIARPDGNVTGVNFVSSELTAKRLREMAAHMK